MLSQQLIDSALALTGKTMENILELVDCGNDVCTNVISIPKFCYYLLSPEFQNTYFQLFLYRDDRLTPECEFWQAIYEYQSGNEEPLTTLLSRT